MKDLKKYYYDPTILDNCSTYYKLKIWLKTSLDNQIDGPWLWIGSGLSIPAGYPSGWTLAEKMLTLIPPVERDGLNEDSSYELVAEKVIEVYNKSHLSGFLERELGRLEDTTRIICCWLRCPGSS